MKTKAEVTKENILKISQILFESHGFEKTTTRMISSKMQMSTGSLFVHFKNKREILISLLHSKIDAAIKKGFKRAKKHQSIDDKIISVFESVFEFYFLNQDFSRELLKGVLFEPNIMILHQVEDFNKQIQVLIEDSIQSGEILPNKDTDTLSGVIFSVYFMILLKEICYEEKASTERAIAKIRSSFDLLF